MNTNNTLSSEKNAFYLSSDGNSIWMSKGAQAQATDRLPEDLAKLSCKTHEEALAFLKRIKSSGLADSFDFYHYNNHHYEAHRPDNTKGMPETAHLCALENQIRFVKYKMLEQEHGARESTGLQDACTLQ